MVMSTASEAEWVVLLEITDERKGSTIDPLSFARLVCSWATPIPTTLYSPKRYALQVALRATDAPLALSAAISLWKDAVRRSGLPEWQLVRAEIMTPEELEEELDAADSSARGEDMPRRLPFRTGDVVADDLLRRAFHDSDTGLPGRQLFLEDVRRALAPGASPSALHAMMIVHFEGLDTAGPSFGFSAPDATVVEVARRLTEGVRCADTVARVGPLDFALLIEVADVQNSDCVARRIVNLFHRAPLHDTQPSTFRASVGVAMSSSTDDPDQLILMAEAAAAAARQAGGNCHTTFTPDPDSV